MSVLPRKSTFLGEDRLPPWAVTLRKELAGGGDEAPPTVLTPLAALDEVIATATSLLDGRGDIPAADRASLGQDVSASLAAVGTSTAASVSAVLRSFQTQDLGLLARLLSDVEGARRLRSAARLLSAEFCLPAASRAAWADCVKAFRTGVDCGTCELRIAQVRELCVRRGHGWPALERHMGGVLSDRYYAVLAAGAKDEEVLPVSQHEAAGLPLERRIELCGAIVEAAPAEVETVVWLAFANAALESDYILCGPMQLFSHRLEVSDIRDGFAGLTTAEFEPPHELGDPALAEGHLSRLPDEPYVLVRIALSAGPVPDAEEHARDLAAGLVDAANPNSLWVLARGAALYSNGGWSGTLGFDDPAEAEAVRRRRDASVDGTSAGLQGLDSRLIRRLADGEEAALAAVAERRWEKAVGAAVDPAQRLALAMRVLERALPVARGADTTLRDACGRYLLDAWVFRTLSEDFLDVAYHGIWSLPRPLEGGGSLQRELQQAVLPFNGETSFTFSPQALMSRVGELVSALPAETMEHRMASEAAAIVATSGDALRHLGELDARFRRLLARAIRQRNTVVHGAVAVPAVIGSCEPFIRNLSRYLVEQRMAAVAEGEELLDRLERARAAWIRQRDALQCGKSPTEVLFAGTLEGETP